MARPLYEIARDIQRDWKNVYFGAVPYLDAMGDLDSISDRYGMDSAPSIVRYFLANANGWRGPVAKEVKAELNAMIKGKFGSAVEVAARHMTKLSYNADGTWYDDDPRAPKTYWGPAQAMYEIQRGVRWFSTSGHGGLAVADGVARKELTPAAYKLGAKQGGYVWYEEDVAYAIPFYEHPEWSEILSRKAGGSAGSKEKFEETVRRWFPEYFKLLESGAAHPRKPKIGDKVRFNKDIRFGSGTVIRAGTEMEITKATPSSVILNYGYRVPVSFLSGNGDIALL